jgi:two-component system sensor histidine kinase CpxA
VRRIGRATEEIAEGRFDVRVAEERHDELGSLAESINRMATRLSGYVSGQRRFLGDIAHELCSPIARIQVALGILEQRADQHQRAYLEDLREEVQQMSGLINELLSFSKASLGERPIDCRPVDLREIAERAVTREAADHPAVRVGIEPGLRARGHPDLLLRALSNLVRNAVRHAGGAGPITLTGHREGNVVQLIVTDCGPGIPADQLEKVFDPFYRVDTSRNRETGGVGLGLAIVKTCVESCGGTVRCQNRAPNGLEVVISLAADDTPPVSRTA